MLFMFLGAAITLFGLPALFIVCVCVTGNRLLKATEYSHGDCASSLAREAPQRPLGAHASQASKARWSGANDQRIDALAN